MKGLGKARGRRKETNFKVEQTKDIKKVLNLIESGFVLVENNTAIEHINGGYQKISKRVTNYFNKIV
mgnify:CR=1 FL=1|tara:strand:+ start:138 stop:338 length:201 start_codon:yes stop_codon:yes gene_type:complete